MFLFIKDISKIVLKEENVTSYYWRINISYELTAELLDKLTEI